MRRLRVLGPLEVDDAAKALGPRDRVVVSALALRPGERVDAETLAEALWGEQPPASWSKVVQGCISRLRQALGTDSIETVAGGYRLQADRLALDRQEFEDLVGRAREHLATRSPERAIPLLKEALALWRGPAFGTLEEWMPGRLEAVRLGQLRLAAEEDLLQARLDAGDHEGVAADGTVLTGQQPFRERRWSLLALAQYRCDRQADALASIRAARRALGQELGLDPGSELSALEARILAQDPTLAADHEARMADQVCPWKGLAPYDDRDGDAFFGREIDVAACLGRLDVVPLLVVSGPSGCGKSSLVRAGLVPALRSDGRSVEVFTPGADGSAAMAHSLARAGGAPVLVIDQFEEAFTLGDEARTTRWMGEIARYAAERAAVVLVVRGDHVARLGADRQLARLAERGLHLVAPLSGDSLRAAVERPAEGAGLRLQPGLADLLVRDADGQPGAMPLLSHVLTEVWRRREGALLTVDGYHAAGGIRDAVAATAERLYDGLGADERTQLRWLVLRLVSLSDSGEPYRTPLPASVALSLDPVRRRLLDLLVRGRLVTSYAGGYEVAHEALVRAWPRLRTWLDEDHAGQQIRRHLAMTAHGWDALGRPESELYRGIRLAAVEDWLGRGQEPLDDIERDFIGASRGVADEQVRRLADEARRRERENRRLRAVVGVAVVLLLVAGAAGTVARDRSQDAEHGLDAATAAAADARHESLVSRSLALRSSNRAAAALLAVQAWRDHPDPLAESALVATLTGAPGMLGYRYQTLGRGLSAATAPGNGFLVVHEASVALVDGSTGSMETFTRDIANIPDHSVLRVSEDGSRVLQFFPQTSALCGSAGPCSALVVYDVASRSWQTGPIRTPFLAGDAAISGDGSLVAVAAADGDRVMVWDARTGRRIAQARHPATALAFGHGGRMYLGSRGGTVREVSARGLTVTRSFHVPPLGANLRAVVAGRRLLVLGDGADAAIDLAAGTTSWTRTHAVGDAQDRCPVLAVTVARQRFYCGTAAGVVVERDLVDGGSTGRVLDPQLGPVSGLALLDHGRELVTLGDGRLEWARWRLDGPGVGGRVLAAGATATGGYNATGLLLLVSRGDHTEVVDAQGSTVRRLPAGVATWLSPTVVGVVGGDHATLVDVESGRRTRVFVDHVQALYPEAGGQWGWALARRATGQLVRRFELENGRPTGTDLPSERDAVAAVVADGRRVIVTGRYGPGFTDVWTQDYDIGTGMLNGEGLDHHTAVAIGPTGTVLAVDGDGRLGEYVSSFYRDTRRVFTVGRGPATSVQISRGGGTVALTWLDASVSVIDLGSRTRLGDPFPTQASGDGVGAWLRPDGAALVTVMPAGVVEWDLEPESLVAAACRLAGRNPSASEWADWAEDPSDSRRICPGLPEDPPGLHTET